MEGVFFGGWNTITQTPVFSWNPVLGLGGTALDSERRYPWFEPHVSSFFSPFYGFWYVFFSVIIAWNFNTVTPQPILGVCTLKHMRLLSKYLSSVRPGPWFEPRLPSFVCLPSFVWVLV